MTRIYLDLAAYNLLLVAVGYAFLYGLGLARLRLREWRLVALSYLLGWAVLGIVLTLLLIAGLDPEVTTVLLAAAAICAVAALVGRRLPATELVATGRRTGGLGLLAATAGAGVLLVAAAAALIVSIKGTWPSEWDVWGFWLAKAKVIYYFHGLAGGLSGYGAQSHPEYPPLVPTMNAAVSHFVGAFHPTLLAFQVVLLGVAFLGAMPALVDRFVPPWLSFPLLALLAVSSGFFWRMQSLMADQTLAYLIATAALACVIWLYEPRPAWLLLALATLVAAALTKLEGATLGLLLAVVVAAAAFVLRGRAGAPALLLLLGPAAIEPWRLWLGSHHLPVSATDYHASDLLKLHFLSARTWRFDYAAHWMLHSVFRTGQWLVILPLALVALLLASGRVPVISVAIAAWIAVGFLGLATIYWIGIPDVHWYVQTSADRVVATIVIVAGVVAPLVLGLALRGRRSS
jgi:hypothetical protein